MPTASEDRKRIETLEQALARITELEKALDDAIDVILRRDERLAMYERKLSELGGSLNGPG
jgi:hypothetical protein